MAELNYTTPGELQIASEQEQSATIEAVKHRPPLCVKCGGSCETIGAVRVCFDCDAVQLSPALATLNKKTI